MQVPDPADGAAAPSGAPVVSIVIPTFDRGTVVGDAIRSALAQTHPSIEVIVVDDGSTDDTPAVLAAFGDDIVALRQANSGVSAARNAGIEAAGGDLVMFLDSDDLLFPDAVAAHVGLFVDGDPVQCTIGDLVLRDPDGSETSLFDERKVRPTAERGRWENVQDVITTRFLFTNQTVCVRRSAFARVGGFDESLWVMEDFDMALRLSKLAPWGFTTQPVTTRRNGDAEGLTSQAMRQPDRLGATISMICDNALSRGIAETPVARRALARMSRRALRMRRSAHGDTLGTRVGRFLEDDVGERLYRNSPWFPRAHVAPFGGGLVATGETP